MLLDVGSICVLEILKSIWRLRGDLDLSTPNEQ
jgi:hypothetical protein